MASLALNRKVTNIFLYEPWSISFYRIIKFWYLFGFFLFSIFIQTVFNFFLLVKISKSTAVLLNRILYVHNYELELKINFNCKGVFTSYKLWDFKNGRSNCSKQTSNCFQQFFFFKQISGRMIKKLIFCLTFLENKF